MVELEHFTSISHEAIRQVLKKRTQTLAKKAVVYSTRTSAEFVAAMEDVLDIYRQPADACNLVVCVDETSKQHIKETLQPLPIVEGSPQRYDYEYQRNGLVICS